MCSNYKLINSLTNWVDFLNYYSFQRFTPEADLFSTKPTASSHSNIIFGQLHLLKLHPYINEEGIFCLHKQFYSCLYWRPSSFYFSSFRDPSRALHHFLFLVLLPKINWCCKQSKSITALPNNLRITFSIIPVPQFTFSFCGNNSFIPTLCFLSFNQLLVHKRLHHFLSLFQMWLK